MADAHDEVDLDTRVLEAIQYVQVEARGDGWQGHTPDWYEGAVFGGFVLGQDVHAATRTAPEHTRIHSLHAYFLAPVASGSTVDYQVRSLRDGRRFSSRLLEATQNGRPVFTMTCSFTHDGDGYEYGAPLDAGVPTPDALSIQTDDGAFETASLGPAEPGPHGVRSSTHRIWIRAARPLPDDPTSMMRFAPTSPTSRGPARDRSTSTATLGGSSASTMLSGSTDRLEPTTGCFMTRTRW